MKNLQLTTISDNMPEYEQVQAEFFEHFSMFVKMGAVNYAALTPRTGFTGFTHAIVAVYLCGLAIGRAKEISNRENCELKVDVWNPLGAWGLVQDELAAIMPDLPRLPEPIQFKIRLDV